MELPRREYTAFRTGRKFEIKYSAIDKCLTLHTAEHDGIFIASNAYSKYYNLTLKVVYRLGYGLGVGFESRYR